MSKIQSVPKKTMTEEQAELEIQPAQPSNSQVAESLDQNKEVEESTLLMEEPRKKI